MSEIVLDMSRIIPEKLPLTDEQEEVIKAIKRGERNICVVGVPAAGKTRLEPAAVRVWLEEGIPPDKILPNTWTITARDILQTRLGNSGVRAQTIYGHGMAHSYIGRKKFLEEHSEDTPGYDCLLAQKGERDEGFERSFYDEGQDLTLAQYLNFLSWAPSRVLVGDPYQSIFGWAGGSPDGMVRFIKDHCDKKEPYYLTINHRSKKAIVDLAERFYKRGMVPTEENNYGGQVNIGSGYPSYIDNCTVLVRWKRQFGDHQKFFHAAGIPYTLVERKGTERISMNFENGRTYTVNKERDYLPTIILTIHCAKGGEWTNVLLDCWETTPDLDLGEEDRCFYVGITRPHERLYIKTRRPNRFTRRVE